MRALLAMLLACLIVVACGAEPIEPEPVAEVAEAVDYDQPEAVEKYELGFLDCVNDVSYGATTRIRYAGAWLALEVSVEDPETYCIQTNGYAPSIASIVASSNPRHMGCTRAYVVMSGLGPPDCP